MINKASKDIKKSMWKRLQDRIKILRRWWYPILPKETSLAPDEWKKQQYEVSTTIRRVMISLIVFSLFSLMTLGTPDSYLLLEGETLKIPYANTQISLRAFLFLGPVMLIGLVIYLHIFIGYSLRLGKIDRYEKPPFIFNMNNPIAVGISWFIFYMLTPLVLLFFYWKAQPLGGSYGMFILALLVLCILIWVQIRRCPINKRRKRAPVLWIIFGFFSLAIALSPVYYNLVVTPGSLLYRTLMLADIDLQKRNLRGIHLNRANLMRAYLQNVDLKRSHLENAFLGDANLEEANLMKAYLVEADFSGANLQKANLQDANLIEADLRAADLRAAYLFRANLRKAVLWEADLRGAILVGAYLWEADLQGANLREADLREANIQGADFSGAMNLSESMIKEAFNWVLARYDGKILNKLNLPLGHNDNILKRSFIEYNFTEGNLVHPVFNNADLRGANLQGTNLRRAFFYEADLRGADLRGADLHEAALRGADLRGADLRNVSNLTIIQLSEVKTLYDTKLDQEYMKLIKKEYPHLLEFLMETR